MEDDINLFARSLIQELDEKFPGLLVNLGTIE